MDIDVVAKPGRKRRVKARQAPSPSSPASLSAMNHLNSAAIPAYVSSLTASPAPAGASPVVSPKAEPTNQVAGASPAVPAQASAASPTSEPTNSAAQAAAMNSVEVDSYIEKAVSSAIAAQVPTVPLTVTVDVVHSVVSPMTGATAATQLAGAAASAPAANPASTPVAAPANNAPVANQAAPQAPATTPSTASNLTPTQAPAMAPSSMPPSSLDINPPVISAPSSPGFSGTASPVVPSAVAATSAVVASQNGTVAAKGQRGCTAKTCKSKRQSRIFGKKSGGQRL